MNGKEAIKCLSNLHLVNTNVHRELTENAECLACRVILIKL